MRYKNPNGETIIVEYNNIIKPNGIYKIQGLGFFNKNTEKYGDLFFDFNIIFPDKLGEDKKDIISKLLPHRKSNNEQYSNISLPCYHLEEKINVENISPHIETEDIYDKTVNECKTQ